MILRTDDLAFYRERKCILLDGAFDPLHAGHIAYLTAAVKSFPYHLFICAIATDDDIRAKGREPLLDQQTRAKVVESLKCIDLVLLKDAPVEHIIGKLKPSAYVKGKDWEGRLPAEQLTACALYDVQIAYLDTVTDSSSDALRRWALRDAARGVDRLETFMAAQVGTPLEQFDTEYFEGEWRKIRYTLEDRRKAEGEHPDRIKDCFGGMQVLDVGCGPGYLVALLRERGVDAGGIDPSEAAIKLAPVNRPVLWGTIEELPEDTCDVAICREVLEHCTVQQIGAMVSHLFRVARRFVYITTRFHEGGLFDVATDLETDPTHISLLTQPFLRALCVLEGATRRRDLETTLDWMQKGRVLVYEIL